MKVSICCSSKLDQATYDDLKILLSEFSDPINFELVQNAFEETYEIWSRSELQLLMDDYRNKDNVPKEEIIVFLTTARDEHNWFSAVMEQWSNDIFVTTFDWNNALFYSYNKRIYPIAYQIIENIFQLLISKNNEDYIMNTHYKPIGCINDQCDNKNEVYFKLRTADICEDCLEIARTRIKTNILDQIFEILEILRFQFLYNDRSYFIFQKIVNKAKVKALAEAKCFLEASLNQNEKYIQDWLDEDEGKYRNQRCLIFGIEYVDPKREGLIYNSKRFDVLAEQNLQNHVIIELKSPMAEIFKIEERENRNGGSYKTFSLSDELARAIPQILQYRRGYEEMNESRVLELGIIEKKKISELIIIIGQRKNDPEWITIFDDLKKTLSIKLITYTDLIDKITNTIYNLENN